MLTSLPQGALASVRRLGCLRLRGAVWELSDEDGLDESCPLGYREGSVLRRTEAGAVEPRGPPGSCGARSPCFSRVLKTHRALLVGGGEGCVLGENGLHLNRNESTVSPMRDTWGTGSQPGARTSLPALLGLELGV